METLKVIFKNNSGLSDKLVSIGFVSGSSTAPFNISYPDPNPLAILPLNQSTGKGNWYALDDLSNGVSIQNFSGRIYVAYGQPWSVKTAYYEPAQNITDPNFFLRYDKMELTFNGKAADVADLTSIDYWSIPMQLETSLNGKVIQIDHGLKKGVTAQIIHNELNSLTSIPQSGLANALPALVPGSFTQSPTQPGTGFARIIGPSSYPPIGGVPVTPYNLFEDYLTHLIQNFGPKTTIGGSIPCLGKGTIATISGQFNGVGPNVPSSGPQSAQAYNLAATIDNSGDITLTGTVGSVSGTTTMLYKKSDLINPSGIYGANAPFSLDGAAPQNPANDVYGWITGDLLAGLNIGAIGSKTVINNIEVGAMPSSNWFTIPNTSLFSNLQNSASNYNQYAATLQKLSDAYNFAYSDRFSPVLISLNPATVDTLQISLLNTSVSATQQPIFQLSALSQNDAGAADGNKIFCEITKITNGSLRAGSFPINKDVHLTTPPGQSGSGPTPTWFLVPDNSILDTTFELEISSPSDANFPKTSITVKATDVQKWAAIPHNQRDNQIYQKGEYGVFGFAQEGPNGLIYTVTAGVLNPQLQA